MPARLAPLLAQVKSAACCAPNTTAHTGEMTRNSKIEPIHREESARLKRLFEERSSLSQEAFGDEYGIGTQGMVWQYLNARSPLNLSAAIKFARGLGVPVSKFSHRLALEMEQLPPDSFAARLFKPVAELEHTRKLNANVRQALESVISLANGAPEETDDQKTHAIP